MLTPAQVRAQVAAIRKKMTDGPRVFALQAQGAWTGPEALEVEGESHRVIACQSDLQMREAVLACETDGRPCILLCDLRTEQIGDDLLARLAKRRLFPQQPNEVLAELFGARVIDPRVLSCKPLIDALINNVPKEGYRPVAGGSLDLQTAWLALLQAMFGECWDAPNLGNVLAWSFDERRIRALAELDEPLRGALTDWLSQTLGPVAQFVLAAMATRVGSELVALGLLLDLLNQPECRGVAEAQVACGRLEQHFGHREIDEASAKAWAMAAGDLLCRRATGDLAAAKQQLVALDRLIEQARVTSLAVHSRFSPSGLEARFQSLGEQLSTCLMSPSSASLNQLAGALRHAELHFLAKEHSARLHRVGMALRLLSWLQAADVPGAKAGFADLAAYYLREGGFVDWARDCLAESDPAGSLREAYQGILARIGGRFGAFEEAWIAALQRWFAEGSPGDAALPIEEVLHTLAGPAARQQPVLLLVLDGMSVAAFRQLLDDLVRRDWVELGNRGLEIPRPAIATLPSITEVSRWSLLAGRLDAGRRGSEKAEFSDNQKLAELAGGAVRPQLFVKGDLSTGEQLGLASEVSAAILNSRCRVVGVVVNAMDDLLAASDQVALAWDIDSIKPLRELLHAARESERLVLITSDHGHVLDAHSQQVGTSAVELGDRYRVRTSAGRVAYPLTPALSPARSGGEGARRAGEGEQVTLHDGEVRITGRRVEQATGRPEVVCLAKTGLRYQTKKRGYHGGACVQEVVVPVAALRHVACPLPEGWEDLPPFQPSWWRLESLSGLEPLLPTPVPAKPRTTVEPRRPELDLFAHAARQSGQPQADWLQSLFQSGLYQEQAQRAARGAPAPELMGRLLKTLEQQGGRMLRPTLAQELGMPLFRIDGLVQSAGRILNLDGYEVISYDRASETVSLNIDLLRRQFDIEEDHGKRRQAPTSPPACSGASAGRQPSPPLRGGEG